ncbi:hypothetical protein THASP1DRAFT_28030 [Thamnocephalis sphaerospora]|uniref:Bromo domain-containing protein n=1 Tax=Thamnocephalis sphaerospora TaxID=78915 RepID=A0A4P9XXP6_9FUNG|nr:hypothetical protein THASP1DRAFT_28030 [Thamnocephalis sphaerospora]|eukprot:RKP10190.1 hypothetical protein THASP1DRAFT_28030 [Thamnocephalis sphaerospora]
MPRQRSVDELESHSPPRASRKRDADAAGSEAGSAPLTPRRGRTPKRSRKDSADSPLQQPDAALSEAEVREICRAVWTELRQYKDASGRMLSKLFQALPSRQEYPDYYEVIEHPIALNNIKTNLDAGRYATVEEFRADMVQMFANARKYNVRGSQVYADAQTLQASGLDRVRLGVYAMFLTTIVITITIIITIPRIAQKLMSTLMPESSAKNTSDEEAGEATDGEALPTSEYVRLLKAITEDDTVTVEAIMNEPGFDPNTLQETELFGDVFSWGPLHCAAFYGRSDMIDALMERGADVELRDTWHRGTALAWSAFGGRADVVRQLIDEYNADPDAKNMHGQVPYDLVSEPEDESWVGLLSPSGRSKRRNRLTKDTAGDDEAAESRVGGKRRSRRARMDEDDEEDGEDEDEDEDDEDDEDGEADEDMGVDEGVAGSDEEDYVDGSSARSPRSKGKRKGKGGALVGGGDGKGDGESKPALDEEVEKPKRPKSARLLREILHSITEYHDETGRCLAEPFLELPTEERFPGYQKKVRRLASFSKIENRIKRGYDSFERYERECMRVLDNAMTYFDEGAQEYKDAVFLKDLLAKNIVEIITKYENCAETPAGIDPRIKLDLTGRSSADTIKVDDQTYSLGEFVYVHDHRDIMIIDRIYKHAEKEPLMIGRLFARPEKVPAAFGRKIVEREVYKTLLSRDFTASDIRGKCYVMPLRDYHHCYPTDFAEEDVYVCNNRYSERATRPFPYIGDWRRSIGVDIYRKVKMTARPTPVRPPKYTLVDENTRPPVPGAPQPPPPPPNVGRAAGMMSDEDELELGGAVGATPAALAAAVAAGDGSGAVGMNGLGIPFLQGVGSPNMFAAGGQMPMSPVGMQMNPAMTAAAAAAYGQLAQANMMMALPGMMRGLQGGVPGAVTDTGLLAMSGGSGNSGIPAEVRSAGELVAAMAGAQSGSTGTPDAASDITLPPGTPFLAEITIESEDHRLCYHLDPRHPAHSLHVQEPVQALTLRPRPADLLRRHGVGPTVFVYQNARLVPPDTPSSTVATPATPTTGGNTPASQPATPATAVAPGTPVSNSSMAAKAVVGTGQSYRVNLLPGLNALEVWASVPLPGRMATGKPELQQFSLFITKA